jgi:hypothetical protein
VSSLVYVRKFESKLLEKFVVEAHRNLSSFSRAELPETTWACDVVLEKARLLEAVGNTESIRLPVAIPPGLIVSHSHFKFLQEQAK